MRMHAQRKRFFARPYLWLIRVIGVIVPRGLRADWRQEWISELRHREILLDEWDRLDWRNKIDLARRSSSAFWDALWLQQLRWEDEMIQDLRYAVRMLLKNKAFSFVAVFSLALGIGANTAIFSLVDAVLLKSLPVQEPEKLVLFGQGGDTGGNTGFPNRSWDLFSYPFYQEMRQRNEVFSEVTALRYNPVTVHGTVNTNGAGGEIEKLNVGLVSGTYFSVLGLNASIGRVFTEADDQISGGHPVAVVSYAWWQSRLGGDPSTIGKTISIDQTPYTIIGVAPKQFFGTTVGQSPDLWLPLAMEPQLPPHSNVRNDKSFQSLYIIARLKNGIRAEQASAAVNVIFKQSLVERAGGQPSAERLQDIQLASIELTPAGQGLSAVRREFSLSLRVMMVVVMLVLLIACANVANLLLGRAAARQKEFAVRLAIGAGHTRLIRQLLIESLLLAGLGGIAGVVLASWGSRMLVLMASSGSEPLPLDISPNARILGFTLLISLLSALIFGTAPALRAVRMDLNSSLKGGKGSAKIGSHGATGKALVVAQVAFSLLLLVGAGLFVRTLINLQSMDTGFDHENVELFRVDITTTGYKRPQFASLMREVEEKIKTVPGVQSASFSTFIFNQGQATSRVYTGGPEQPEGQKSVSQNIVGPDYFTTMGIPLVSGRVFGPQDTDSSLRVAVISESMAQRFYPNESPLGKRFTTYGSNVQLEIIGVVKDAKYGTVTEQLRPMAYYPHSQIPQALGNFVVRFNGTPDSLIPQVRQTIRQVNSNLAIDEVVSLSEHIGRSLTRQKLVSKLGAFFGLLALLLACIGLYGVSSHSVAQRTSEIGIRMALGAQSSDVLWLVLGKSLVLVLAGVVIGLAAALYATRIAEGLLFQLTPTDPLTLASATLLLIIVATLAGYLPARRAARVDPMVALRHG